MRKTTTPIITVAMTAYNHAPFIGDAIESALSQGIENLEVVIVDDASVDDTAAIAESFSARDARVRVIRNPRNLGPSIAANECLRLARGRYLAVFTSDDLFAPGKLAAQLDYLEQHPKDAIVATGVEFIDNKNRTIKHQRNFAASFFDTKTRTRGQWMRYFFNCGNNLCASSLMLRTDLYRAHQNDRRLLQMQDYDSWVRLVLAGHGIGMLKEPLTRYRILDNHANLSAPTDAVRARAMFEYTQVLTRYYTLKRMDELLEMLPDETPVLEKDVAEEAYVQHRLSTHAWNIGTPQHRMFALYNWYRLLGHEEWVEGLETLGVNVKFLASKSAQNPLAEAISHTPAGILRYQAERWLPAALRNAIVRHVRNHRENL